MMSFKFVALILALFICSIGFAQNGNPNDGFGVPEPEFVEDEIIVTFKNTVKKEDENITLSVLPGFVEIKKALQDTNKRPNYLGGGKGINPNNTVLVKVNPGTDIKQACEVLRENPNIKYANPNYIVRINQNFPNDPDFDLLWAMNNTGQTGGTIDADIDAVEAWELTTGNSAVLCAVIDTGVLYSHPDIAANMWVNPGEIPDNGVDDDENGFIDDIYGIDLVNDDSDPIDDHFHGTHCAGTVGGVGNNGQGVAGVNWTVRIMAVKFLNSGGSGSTYDAIDSLQYALNNGARVTSNSYGGGGYIQDFQDMITAARQNNCLFVAAAGNNNADVMNFYPAAYDGVVTVAATDHNDLKASFSNWGQQIDVSAPGVNIWSLDLEDGYRYASGTSMACPHAAGVCCLMLSLNLSLTPDELELILENTADDLGESGWDVYFGHGRINANNAVAFVGTGIPLPTVVITSPIQGQAITTGAVDILGTVQGEGINDWILEYAAAETGWVVLNSSNSQVEDAYLGTINTGELDDQNINVRLTANLIENLTFSHAIVVLVDNIASQLYFNSTVSSKIHELPLYGTADVNFGTFVNYQLEYGLGLNPTEFFTDRIELVNDGTTPVQDGLLGVFDPFGLDGNVTIRLIVFSSEGDEIVSSNVFVDKWLRQNYPVTITGMDHYATLVADLIGDGALEMVATRSDSWGIFPHLPLFMYDFEGNLQATITNPHSADGFVRNAMSMVAGDLFDTPGLEYVVADDISNELQVYNGADLLLSVPIEGSFTLLTQFDKTVSIMLYDVNNDSNLDIIFPERFWNTETVTTITRLHVIDTNGNELPGFPFEYEIDASDTYLATAHKGGAIGDLDNDGFPEIYFTVNEKVPGISWNAKSWLFGLDHQGNLLDGFPIYHERVPSIDIPWTRLSIGNINIADINGDGVKELVYPYTEVVVGETLQPPEGDPTVLIDIHSILQIRAVDKNHNYLPGFPVIFDDGNWQADGGGCIALGDLTGDGFPEIVVSNNAGHASAPAGFEVYVVDRNGNFLFGIDDNQGVPGSDFSRFSRTTTISIADLDIDGKGEILVHRLFVTSDQGWAGHQGIIIYDDDGTPIQDMVMVVGEDEGTGEPRYPLINWGKTTIELLDIEGDGLMEAVVATMSSDSPPPAQPRVGSNYYVFELGIPDHGVKYWTMHRGNQHRTGEYMPQGEFTCLADTNGDGVVDVDDLDNIILGWGECESFCVADINNDGIVDVDDLIEVIVGWGDC